MLLLPWKLLPKLRILTSDFGLLYLHCTPEGAGALIVKSVVAMGGIANAAESLALVLFRLDQ